MRALHVGLGMTCRAAAGLRRNKKAGSKKPRGRAAPAGRAAPCLTHPSVRLFRQSISRTSSCATAGITTRETFKRAPYDSWRIALSCSRRAWLVRAYPGCGTLALAANCRGAGRPLPILGTDNPYSGHLQTKTAPASNYRSHSWTGQARYVHRTNVSLLTRNAPRHPAIGRGHAYVSAAPPWRKRGHQG